MVGGRAYPAVVTSSAGDTAPRGAFIVFEGGEGTGKSTQAALLADRLRGMAHEVVLTREPGGSPVAEAIRELLLSDALDGSDPWCEAMMFAAARADHTAAVIEPALDCGAVVVCDRFVDSSVVYQGVARGLGADTVRQVSMIATRGRVADLTLVLDIDPEIGLSRARDGNRLEAEGVDFHRTVRQAMLDIAEGTPGYVVIDASVSVDEVADRVWQAVGPLFAGEDQS